MKKVLRLPAIAFDKDVLKLVAPAYSLPLAIGGLSTLTGIGALAVVWPWLFVPALGLHGLLALNVANRAAADDRPDPDFDAPPDLAKLKSELEEGFKEVKSPEGVKAVEDLVYEYAQLQPTMSRRRVADSLSIAHIPALASETYRQGLSVLQDALDLTRAISSADRERLEHEIEDIEKEIASLSQDESQAGRVKIRKERLASNRELLELMRTQQLRVDELLYQADRCGASLHKARMELAALRADSSEEGVNAVTETLRLTINHAKGVQDEMKQFRT